MRVFLLISLTFIVVLCHEHAPSRDGNQDTHSDYELGYLHSNEQMVGFMKYYAKKYPNITRLRELGRATNDEPIYEFVISSAIDLLSAERATNRSAVRLTANLHGNDFLGRELLLFLIDLMTSEYSNETSWSHRFLMSSDIYLLPTCNPHGFSKNIPFNKEDGTDLNKDFPDFQFGNENTEKGRQPETQILMKHIKENYVTLSGEFQSGGISVSYPYHCNPSKQKAYSKAPDDSLFINLAHQFADDISFHGLNEKVISNGGEQECVIGTLQDYQYGFYGIISEVFEVSKEKEINDGFEKYWLTFKQPIINYLNSVLTFGVKGFVTNKNGIPMNATIHVESIEKPIYTNPKNGYFHRLLLPGTYTMWAEAEGEMLSDKINVVVENGTIAIMNFTIDHKKFHIGDGVSTATVAVVISAMAILCGVVITIAFILSARKQRREAERMILEDEEEDEEGEEGEEENKEDFGDGDFADKHNTFEYKTEDLSEDEPKEEMLSDIDDVMETDDEN